VGVFAGALAVAALIELPPPYRDRRYGRRADQHPAPAASRMIVPRSDTRMDPRQPSLLEKKTNTSA
jgi:hypothetical protein